ncbi:MAG: GNAT family N-acetyltransferase [Verrucomicrobiales bacterium]
MSSVNEYGQPISNDLSEWEAPPFPEKEIIDGQFCRLEPLDADAHADGLFAANARSENDANWTYLPYCQPSDVDAYSDWVHSVWAANDPQFFAVILKSTEQVAGVLRYLRIEPEIGSIEVGHIHFSELIQRTSAATEAIFLMMNRAFELGYRRFE